MAFLSAGLQGAARLRSSDGQTAPLALQLVVFVVLLSVVISIAAAETGPFEKGALSLLEAGSVWLASRLRGTAMRPA